MFHLIYLAYTSEVATVSHAGMPYLTLFLVLSTNLYMSQLIKICSDSTIGILMKDLRD